jgi:hypothetical protein
MSAAHLLKIKIPHNYHRCINYVFLEWYKDWNGIDILNEIVKYTFDKFYSNFQWFLSSNFARNRFLGSKNDFGVKIVQRRNKKTLKICVKFVTINCEICQIRILNYIAVSFMFSTRAKRLLKVLVDVRCCLQIWDAKDAQTIVGMVSKAVQWWTHFKWLDVHANLF